MTEFFKNVPTIQYEGPDSDNPLAFKYYQPGRKIGGKTMREHLRFAVAYWHAFCNAGADPFGAGTRNMPWETGDPMRTARNKVDACFEFASKLQIGFYCFHDTDVAPEGKTLTESFANFDAIVPLLAAAQKRTGVKLLWGTANCFSHPRFMHGAGTSCNADAFAYAAAKIAKAMDVTKELGGAGYVFWGGREGYRSLLNTNMKRELDHLAKLLHLAVEYKHKIGFKGQLYIEPKPKEPTKHQYDSDAASCYAFLQHYRLDKELKLNIEANHATLAGHTFQHELEYCAAHGILGSIDANRGDPQLGWDTDQFPTDLYDATLAMLPLLKTGGFTTGGLNFDARVTRESVEPVDLAHAHIGGMDAFARGLLAASKIRKEGKFDQFIKQRYASWDSGIGEKIETGETTLDELRTYMLKKGEISPNASGRIEMLENMLNQYL
ncbi:MAG: xylose isomerase [Phycisphaerales bacterium]